MKAPPYYSLFCLSLGLISIAFSAPHASAATPFAPLDFQTKVNGVQDDFEGSTLRTNWVVRGRNVFSVSDGMLHVTSPTGDPNHLLYEKVAYNNSVQEILARIQVTSFGTGDNPRAGIAAAVSVSTSQGINLHFRDEPNPGSRHLELLDDTRAWGPEFPLNWQEGVWYWLRLRHDPNAGSQGGVNDVFAKVWKADGTEPEPPNWQLSWDYTPGRSTRFGFAGVSAGAQSAPSEFNIDYLLIKASGLPSITVSPSVFIEVPAEITRPPQTQSVVEGSPLALSVGWKGNPLPSFQWIRNGDVLPGATNPIYTLSAARLGDGGNYSVRISNTASNVPYSQISSEAAVEIIPDTFPPTLQEVRSLNATQLLIRFSERMNSSSLSDIGRYSVQSQTGGLPIQSALPDASGSNVVLTISSFVEGNTYTLRVNGLRDTSAAANPIAPDTSRSFTAFFYEPSTIGDSQPGGSSEAVPGGLNLTAGGRDIGGTADEFQFNHKPRTGDFDVKVRLEALGATDLWSEAGLLAREDLSPGSRFVAALATPSISGAYWQYRVTNNAVAATGGAFPVNYPNTWLRLQRSGNRFAAYAGVDGEHWSLLGATNLSFPATLYLGFAASSHTTNETTTAAFRSFGDVSNPLPNTTPLATEPLGQSSRRTGLVISEIMYHPSDRTDGKNLEFVELFNSQALAQDLSDWRLDGDADFRFPPGTTLAPGAFLLVAASPQDLSAVIGQKGIFGPFSNTNGLPNSRGTIRLRNRIGAVFLEANYDSTAPWPASADGAGHSLVLARPSYGEGNPQAWAASQKVGGSPGGPESIVADPLQNVVINEFLANPVGSGQDFIELYNHGNTAVDLSGCLLSDSPNTNKFAIPSPTLLAPRGFISFNQTQLGFGLSSAGEAIYLRNPSGTRVIDAWVFGAQDLGVSSGRVPDGAARFVELASPTPGLANSGPQRRSIVINEIMYNPISGDTDDQYVELYNLSPQPVNLAHWEISGGIRFRFPSPALIPPDGYVVISRNVTRMLSRYPALRAEQVFGDFSGSLSKSGERIVLNMAIPVVTTNNGSTATNVNLIAVDEVSYADGGRWGQWSDGGGSSLELKDPRSDNRLAPNWADSDETRKAPWTTVEVTGVLDNGTSTADRFQTLLQGRGECLIDNVEVRTLTGVNVLTNSTFEANANGWTAEGTQSQSGWEPSEGFESAASYHVRASDRGDNQVNRIRARIAPSQTANRTNTIRAKVRWLKGHPELLFRLSGNWLEAAVRMDLPTNLGTPGTRNSRAVTNDGPAIHDVTHYPAVPATGEAVIVQAKVDDPDGIASVSLNYRLDPATTMLSVPMLDDGTGGDAVAGDGVFAATLPGQPANTLVAFHVQSTDSAQPAARATFPADAPAHECLVRFGESVPAGNLPSYRFWMTRAAFTAWDTRNNLNNTLNDVTFVLGNHRVIYNAAASYAGSPYIAPGFDTPTSGFCGYSVEIPSDEPFLGDNALVLDWPGGHGNETTAIQEQMAYWIAEQSDLPFSHRYFIRLTVNGVTDMQRGGVFEAVLQPAQDFLRQWSPGDSEGDFFKIDRAFEFDDSGSRLADPEPQLRIYRTPDLLNGGFKHKTETYRWYWLKRSFDSANDYTNLFVAADVLNSAGPEPYTSQTEALIDVEEWMGIFAMEHIINNFDSWGHDIGKNMYMFKPRNGRWQIYMFDLDWLMLVAAGNYPPESGGLFVSDDPTITRMYNHPPFRRAYLRTIEKAVNRAFDPEKYGPIMDAKYSALLANGVNRCDGQVLEAPTALKNWFRLRRIFLVSQLRAATVNFAITSNGGNDFTTNSGIALLTGTAPLAVKGIRVNGADQEIRWTTLTNWTLRLAVKPGANPLHVQAYDPAGNPLPEFTDTIQITSTANAATPAGNVVINEIMYQAARPDGEFVELFNRNPTQAFSLAGWQLEGVDGVFPQGTIIDPNGFLVMARNRDAFARAYSGSNRVAATFSGSFPVGGGALSLIQPGLEVARGPVIDQVVFEWGLPWPESANGQGPSLQLVDAAQDNSRVVNWIAAKATPGTTNTGVKPLPSFPSVWLNELQPRNASGPRDGAGDNDPWLELYNAGSTPVSLEGWYLSDNYTNPTRWAFPPGAVIAPGQFLLIWLDGEPAESTPSAWHTSFRIPESNGSVALVFPFQGQPAVLDYLNYGEGAADRSVGYHPDGQAGPRRSLFFPTPGGANNGSQTLARVVINEWMAANTTALADPADGDYEDWFELYNPGDQAVDLTGYSLTDRPQDAASRWMPPYPITIPPKGFLLVWADEETAQNQPGGADLHVNFKLSQGGESIALFAPDGSLVDSITFGATVENVTQGRWPDGDTGRVYSLSRPTPRAPNVRSEPPITAPRIISLSFPPDVPASITWSSEAGAKYVVQSADELTPGTWIDSPVIQATGTTTSAVITQGGLARRFYRVVRLAVTPD